jgi:D-alanyl-D-alanine carboxypeptidase (penicillin-binding protein 5/6)
MKKTTKSTPSFFRQALNIASLTGLSGFLIFSPAIGISSSNKPLVKAAFTVEPPLPVSREIPAPSLTATGIYITDMESGVVLYDKNPHQRHKPASLTKIVTSLVALDYYNDDSILSVKNGQNSTGNTINLRKGDQIIADDMLFALLVPSGNDAAVTLAENYPGGYSAFVDKMNSKVLDMGLQDTHFVNVSGVESQNHYTSAYDIAMLAKSALKRPKFAQIVSTQKITLKSLKGNIYPLETTNILLGNPGIFGVKTGWTPEAGECLVILAEKDNHPVLISILNSKDRFGEAQKLFNWVYKNFSWE